MHHKYLTLLLLLFTLRPVGLSAGTPPPFVDFINRSHGWVDSVFQQLTPRERVAQLFMVRAHSNLGQRYTDSVARIVSDQQIGGIVLFQGGPFGHAQVINDYQRRSRVPLLVALDGEWGLGMRMPDSTVSYPYQMTLGAIRDEGLIYQMGRQIGQDFRRLGLNINFAPVVDINNNPNNPVINFRSFGEDPENVIQKGAAYMRGLMDAGIMVSLKHFPGHGDTDVDSHHDLPVLPFSSERLDSLEISPFRQLIQKGASGVMVAHMHIPSLDDTPNLPSSLSRPIVTGILKEQLGFRGLIFTDAMDMKGVTKYFPDGEADLRAMIAGNDVLELSENTARAIDLVMAAIDSGAIDPEDVEQRVKKVLAAKYWLGLQGASSLVDTQNLYQELNRPESRRLVSRLAESALTWSGGDDRLNLSRRRETVLLSVGELDGVTAFEEQVQGQFEQFYSLHLRPDAAVEELDAIAASLARFDQIILAVHDTRTRPRNRLPIAPETQQFLAAIANRSKAVCLFMNPYALSDLPGLAGMSNLLFCYQNDAFMQVAAARFVLGELRSRGRLPVMTGRAD